MMSYFLYTIISLGCSYVVYFLMLRKQKTFQFNRFFLLSALVLCLVAPFVEFDMFKTVPSITQIPLETFTKTSNLADTTENFEIGEAVNLNQSHTNPVTFVYIFISFLFALRFLKNLRQLYSLTRTDFETISQLKLIKIQDSDMVSSFFNYVFIPENHSFNKADYDGIIAHETVHSKELHTIDIIILELLSCVFWFNPFIWLYKKAISQNHEFIADERVVSSGIDIENYSNTIINCGQKAYRVPLTSGFNFIQIKKRITMLHQSKTSAIHQTLKITSVILLLTGIFIFSSCKEDLEDSLLEEDALVVVIDAGHGGKDTGNTTHGVNEKDIVLNISKYLKAMSDDKLKIITTRTNDEFSSLEERVKFINLQKPDLTVSIHCNSHSNSTNSGVEAYYYESENSERYSESMKYSSTLVSGMVGYGFDKAKIKPSNFYIARNAESPVVILEIGFMTNNEDMSIISIVEQQKEIAQNIYDSLLEGSRI